MQNLTPCTDYQETKGLIYFARMLDKIRLNAAGKLAPGYRADLVAFDPTDITVLATWIAGKKAN